MNRMKVTTVGNSIGIVLTKEILTKPSLLARSNHPARR